MTAKQAYYVLQTADLSELPEELKAAIRIALLAMHMNLECKSITYVDCHNALGKMFEESIITIDEYFRIKEKLDYFRIKEKLDYNNGKGE